MRRGRAPGTGRRPRPTPAPRRPPRRGRLGAPTRWALDALVATLCCIPSAAAVALGLSLGTAAALGELLVYRPLFVAAGLALGGGLLWTNLRGPRAACDPHQRRRMLDRGLTLALFSFAGMYLLLNQIAVPFLYDLRWTIR